MIWITKLAFSDLNIVIGMKLMITMPLLVFLHRLVYRCCFIGVFYYFCEDF